MAGLSVRAAVIVCRLPDGRRAWPKEGRTKGPRSPLRLTREETRSVKERLRLRAAVVYEIIRLEGEAELGRSFSALWWSALAAGISIGFSVLSQAMFAALLGDAPAASVIADLGYTVGFLIVILAHQQLFTENTLTAVLPVMARKDWKAILYVLRLWGIVLVGNIVGCFLFAAFLAYSGALNAEFASEGSEDRRGAHGQHADGDVRQGHRRRLAHRSACVDVAFFGGERVLRDHADHIHHRARRLHPHHRGFG